MPGHVGEALLEHAVDHDRAFTVERQIRRVDLPDASDPGPRLEAGEERLRGGGEAHLVERAGAEVGHHGPGHGQAAIEQKP